MVKWYKSWAAKGVKWFKGEGVTFPEGVKWGKGWAAKGVKWWKSEGIICPEAGKMS